MANKLIKIITRNGKVHPGFKVSVEYLILRHDIVYAVQHELYLASYRAPKITSKGAILSAVKDVKRAYGDDWFPEGRDYEELEEHANEIVDEIFPELKEGA